MKVRCHTCYISCFCIVTAVVSGQECAGPIGSLNHDGHVVPHGVTYILTEYVVPCSKTVVAWEFCYQISAATSVTFYPGIWRMTGMADSNTDYEIVQSNNVTYDSSIQTNDVDSNSCQKVNLSTTDQFTAPAGSVVGLYSNFPAQLLYTDSSSLITTYKFDFSDANNNGSVHYNIAIRVHFGKTM